MASRMIRRRRRERNAIIPRPRVYRDRSNPLETMTDSELFERYRFRRPTIEFITDGISHLLTSSTRRKQANLTHRANTAFSAVCGHGGQFGSHR
jgi:hypothetical protein